MDRRCLLLIIIVVSINFHMTAGGIFEDALETIQQTLQLDRLTDPSAYSTDSSNEGSENSDDPTSVQFTNRDFKIVLGDSGIQTINSIFDKIFNFTTQLHDKSGSFDNLGKSINKFVRNSGKSLHSQRRFVPNFSQDIYVNKESNHYPYEYMIDEEVEKRHPWDGRVRENTNKPKKRRRPILTSEDAPYYFDSAAGRLRYNFLANDEPYYKDLIAADAMRQSQILKMKTPRENGKASSKGAATLTPHVISSPLVLEMPFPALPKPSKLIRTTDNDKMRLLFRSDHKNVEEMRWNEKTDVKVNGDLIGISLPGFGDFVVQKKKTFSDELKDNSNSKSQNLLTGEKENHDDNVTAAEKKNNGMLGKEVIYFGDSTQDIPLISKALPLIQNEVKPKMGTQNTKSEYINTFSSNNDNDLSTSNATFENEPNIKPTQSSSTAKSLDHKIFNKIQESVIKFRAKNSIDGNAQLPNSQYTGVQNSNLRDPSKNATKDSVVIHKVTMINQINKQLSSLPNDTKNYLDSVVQFLRSAKAGKNETGAAPSLEKFLMNNFTNFDLNQPSSQNIFIVAPKVRSENNNDAGLQSENKKMATKLQGDLNASNVTIQSSSKEVIDSDGNDSTEHSRGDKKGRGSKIRFLEDNIDNEKSSETHRLNALLFKPAFLPSSLVNQTGKDLHNGYTPLSQPGGVINTVTSAEAAKDSTFVSETAPNKLKYENKNGYTRQSFLSVYDHDSNSPQDRNSESLNQKSKFRSAVSAVGNSQGFRDMNNIKQFKINRHAYKDNFKNSVPRIYERLKPPKAPGNIPKIHIHNDQEDDLNKYLQYMAELDDVVRSVKNDQYMKNLKRGKQVSHYGRNPKLYRNRQKLRKNMQPPPISLYSLFHSLY